MANTNWANGGKIYSPYVKPVLLNASFVVASSNSNGLGITSLKGSGIDAVFMHTSATPGSSGGLLNPNPPNGFVIINTAENYAKCLGNFVAISGPLSGTPLTSVTVNNVYTITSLGTATTAQWVAKGVPIGITPAVGVTFTATATGTIGGSAAVQAPLSTGSGIDHLELVGDVNTTLGGINTQGQTGAFITFQCFKNGVLTQPANGSTISVTLWFNDSQVQVAGQ